MNNKIIGFTISKNKIDHSDIDIFGANLQRLIITQPDYYLYLWDRKYTKMFFKQKHCFPIISAAEKPQRQKYNYSDPEKRDFS